LIKEITAISTIIIKSKRDNKIEKEKHEALIEEIDAIIKKTNENME